MDEYSTDNQFTAYRASVKSQLKAGTNALVLDFESAFCKVRRLIVWSSGCSYLAELLYPREEKLRSNTKSSTYGMATRVVFMFAKPNTSQSGLCHNFTRELKYRHLLVMAGIGVRLPRN